MRRKALFHSPGSVPLSALSSEKPSPCFLSRSPALEHLTPPLYPSLIRSLLLSYARQVRPRGSRGRWGNNLSLPRLVRFSAHGHHTVFVRVRKLQLHVKLAFSWLSLHIDGVIRRRHSNSCAIFNTPACLFRRPKWPTSYRRTNENNNSNIQNAEKKN